MLPEHVRRSALLVLVQELQVLRIWRCGFQSFKVEEGRFQLPFNMFTSSCQARTGKLLFGIHIRRKQWITSKGESLRPDGTCWNLLEPAGTCWNLLEPDRPDGVLQYVGQYVAIRCNQCVHVRLGKPQKEGSQSEAQCSRAWCVGQWSAACASGHQHLKASQSSLSGNSWNSVWEWDRINRFERFEMCSRSF